MYQFLVRKILFNFDAECVHNFTFKFLKFAFKIPFVSSIVKSYFEVNSPKLEREVFGIKFKNPIGLAAGLDKNAKLIKELSAFGFGFIEIGTLTPKAQPGNDKKRLFRLIEDEGIINRMGFNNEGVETAVKQLKKNKNIIIGGNIGKNKITPNEKAEEDYLICFNALFDYVDYFVLNVSSPNTPNLRELQEKEPLTKLLNTIQKENQKKNNPKPILLKIAPDLTNEQLLDIIDIVEETRISGIIATNTIISRKNLISKYQNETGGLSGKPLTKKSTEVIKFLKNHQKTNFLIIGVGGIHTPEDAIEKLNAGASLIQLYTGFIYEGPILIKKINKKLLSLK